MPLYVDYEQIRLRLTGKVRFTEDPTEENRMQKSLALKLIDEAEGQVEYDLSPRYSAPWATTDGGAFATLPARPTQMILKTLCELKACERILDTDFGKGSAVDATKYKKQLADQYKLMTERVLQKRKEGDAGGQGWAYPPLPGLALMWGNAAADSGFSGEVIVASGSPSQGYAAGQVNDPAVTFWNSFYGNC